MNQQDILSRLFPQPTATFAGRGGTEVNGLPKDTVPQNCAIVVSGREPASAWNKGRREYYLVRVDDALVFLRVCTAMEGSGYDEFAVIREVAVTDEDKKRLEPYARESIETLCRVRG